MDKDKEHRHSLLSGLGRIHLQVNCDKTIHRRGGGDVTGLYLLLCSMAIRT